MTEDRSNRAEQGGRRHVAPAVTAVAPLALLLLCALSLAAGARTTKAPRPIHLPRGPAEITKALAQGPHAGNCESCHSEHAADQPIAYEKALIGPNDNTLCDVCHNLPWSGGSYADTWTYVGSAHGSSTTAVWPGPDPPARTEAGAAGKCLNCHEPHGLSDGSGLIPFLAFQREEALCLTCHDGNPAAVNIRSDALKAFNHPTLTYSGRHTGPTESQPSDFAVSPVNQRHAECEDCHNPHVARGDGPLPPAPPAASKRLLGVSRVDVLNGAAGTVPSYTFIAGSDTLTPPVTEYQLCFKCHSSWTTQPSGQTDLARVLNPANPSTHPVEAPGANTNIDLAAFTGGWSATSLTACGSCHGSDLGAAGPHGSTYRYILKQPYDASPATRSMSSNELCFSCHTYEVYADAGSSTAVQGASRFNGPQTDKGHVFHVDSQRLPCYACHTTHGSTTLPHLLVTGRNPGAISFTQDATTGTCVSTCHVARTYTVNYAR